MTLALLPQATQQELALQQGLSHRQCHYAGEQGQASLSISIPTDDLDLAIKADWYGLPLRLLCRQQRLAQWLAPQLQEADFASLPKALQLALLQQGAARLAGLQCLGLEAAHITDSQPCLQVTLHNAGNLLPCWAQGDIEPVLARLPRKPLHEHLNMPLALSLQWRPVEITLHTLRGLGQGDVLLLPAGTTASPPLLGVLNGQPWADLLLVDATLELLRMHDTPPLTPTPLDTLEQLPIPVSFEVGRQTLDLHTLSTLQPGALINLESPLQAEVRILANQHCIGSGLLVQIEGRLGVRITRLLDERPA